jgi:hypothetical protein
MGKWMLVIVVAAMVMNQEAFAQSQNVNVGLVELLRVTGTNGPGDGPGDTDEVYIHVIGQTPKGGINARLPRSIHKEDYYEFPPNHIATSASDWSWTNQEQVGQGCPEIWNGSLQNGQRAEFLVLVLEQDNKNLKPLKDFLGASIQAASLVNPKLTLIKPLIDQLPEKKADDRIGAVAIVVENQNGQIVSTFEPILTPELNSNVDRNAPALANYVGAGNQKWAAHFDMHGTGGAHYRAIFAAAPTVQEVRLARMWLCKDADGTGKAWQVDVEVNLGGGKVDVSTIANGKSRLFRPAFREDGFFYWNQKGDQKGRTRPSDQATTMVIGRFFAEEKTVRWSCFKEVPW